MARGQAFAGGPTTVTDTSFLTIQPSAGLEAVIHNLYLPAAGSGYELHWYDGSTSEKIDTLSGSLYNCLFHVTNARYLRVKNVSGASRNCGWDGVYSWP